MPLYNPTRQPAPAPATGQYFFTTTAPAVTTSATLGVGSLRLHPVLIETTIRIDRLGSEITTIGEAGSKLRLGIYADTGNCYPGSLLLDAGTIAGDSATVQEITISTTTLAAGLYWIGGAVQVVSVTQPTVRIPTTWAPPIIVSAGSSAPAAAATPVGYLQTSVTGAFPASFTAANATTTAAPRVFARVA